MYKNVYLHFILFYFVILFRNCLFLKFYRVLYILKTVEKLKPK